MQKKKKKKKGPYPVSAYVKNSLTSTYGMPAIGRLSEKI